ncbi:MAG: PIG-L family deacetylase, partial [Thermoanaerobaculia bacterium]
MIRRLKLVHALSLAAVLGSALLFPRAGFAQPTEAMSAGELQLALRKLSVVGSALYVAAHPDDENTAFLSYLSRERLVRTAYLSMTRGDGGQNLIGSEKGELMGVIRTQELLAARRIDGAQQFFTRAIDFGYSKTPQETLGIWGKDAVLADVVFVIRRFRPDVIVTRFPTTGEGGHGHHTASAILAEEAFEAAGDPTRFPEQLALVKPWKPRRLLWNIFRFGADAPRTPKPGQLTVDLGAYNNLLGRSYTEIAAQSRSMHKSQGFGSAERRGTFLNDFQPRLGAPAQNDLFDGLDLSWNRIAGGQNVGKLLAEAERAFDPKKPSASVPALLRAYREMLKLGDPPDVVAKEQELREVVRSCAGLWIEAIAVERSATPGSTVHVKAMALNRSPLPLVLTKLEVTDQTSAPAPAAELKSNEPVRPELTLALPANVEYTNPYWLKERPGKGLFTVKDPQLIGRPDSPPPLVARFTVQIAGESLVFETPVFSRITDPVKGELYRPFEIGPRVTLNLDERVFLFPGSGPRTARVTVRAGEPSSSGRVRLKLPAGWTATPADVSFDLKQRDDEMNALFQVTPSGAPGTGVLEAVAETGGVTVSRSMLRIEYPHIPVQTLFPPAESHLVRLDV